MKITLIHSNCLELVKAAVFHFGADLDKSQALSLSCYGAVLGLAGLVLHVPGLLLTVGGVGD